MTVKLIVRVIITACFVPTLRDFTAPMAMSVVTVEIATTTKFTMIARFVVVATFEAGSASAIVTIVA